MSVLRQCVRLGAHHANSHTAAHRFHQCRVFPSVQNVLSRLYSDSRTHGDVRIEKHEGYAVMHMGRKPVNALSPKFLTEIAEAVQNVESDPSMNGLIVTSEFPKVFTAGLDIPLLYQKSSESIDTLWRSFQDMWLALYGTRLATLAAVNGHAPAGGCVIAMTCDYRMMADGPYTIGLNEVALAVNVQTFVKDTAVNTIGHRKAEKIIELGVMHTPREALQNEIVDEVVPKDELMDRARAQIEKWITIPGVARNATKQELRQPFLEKLRSTREEDIKMFTSHIQLESVQSYLKQYLEKLKKK